MTGTERVFPGEKLPPGKWSISVKIIDPSENKVISEPKTTVTILPKNPQDDDFDNDGVKNSDDKCLYIP